MNYGVIAEFNPFHNGHKYLFDSIKKHSGDTVTVVMSEHFVQRGEPAVMSSSARAECALRCGADLVLSLPVRFSLSGASYFAFGGVAMLTGLGIIDCLAFGSECGSAPVLIKCAEALSDEKVNTETQHLVRGGSSYPAARAAAVRAYYGVDFEKIMSSPNDILALEYIRALRAFCASPGAVKEICAVKRGGDRHDGETPLNEFASAAFIRNRMRCGADIEKYVPKAVYDIIQRESDAGRAPSDINKLENAVLYKLRMTKTDELFEVEGIDTGLANRIFDASRSAETLEELFAAVKTKRYTHASIRRVCMRAFLGMNGADFSARRAPEYIRVLGFNKNGEALLSAAKRRAALPIVTKLSEIKKLGSAAQAEFAAECTARDIFSLSLPVIQPCGLEMTEKIAIINSDT